MNIGSSFDPVTGKESATNSPPPNVVKLSASWEDKPLVELRPLSAIGRTPLAERTV
ncbi:hypothetical protein [Methylobacter psychrophilus]|uniref:hypothetical protein n=1 Tax=Methylobacter psychrophilus TaxID=96941 RepID=UPI0021D4E18F|nr:hypothetical protein [Methylobacter psychrophilus]